MDSISRPFSGHKRSTRTPEQMAQRADGGRWPPPWPPLAPQTIALMLHRGHAEYSGAGAPPLAAFPAELRPRIWAQLLELETAQSVPVPAARRGGDAWRRADAMVARVFHARKPGTIGRQTGWTREMKRTTAAVASVLLVSPRAESLGFLPTVAAGFVRVWGRDTASAAAATLGCLATYGVGLDWFQTAPFAPFVLLTALDDAFSMIDPPLHESLTTAPLSLGPPDYLWPALRSLLIEVLPNFAWVELMDHVLQRPPNFLPALVLAFVRANRQAIAELRADAAERAEREVVRAGPIAKVRGSCDRTDDRPEGSWKGYAGSPRGLDQSLRMPPRSAQQQHDRHAHMNRDVGSAGAEADEIAVSPAEMARRLFRRENDNLELNDLLADADSLVQLGVQFGVAEVQPICVREGVFIDHIGAAMAAADARCNESYTTELWERCRAEEEMLLQQRQREAAAATAGVVAPEPEPEPELAGNSELLPHSDAEVKHSSTIRQVLPTHAETDF
jgi:hypothetical protein